MAPNKNQMDAGIAPVIKDVAKIEVVVEALRDRVSKLESKVVLAISLQALNMLILGFVLQKLFDIVAKVK